MVNRTFLRCQPLLMPLCSPMPCMRRRSSGAGEVKDRWDCACKTLARTCIEAGQPTEYWAVTCARAGACKRAGVWVCGPAGVWPCGRAVAQQSGARMSPRHPTPSHPFTPTNRRKIDLSEYKDGPRGIKYYGKLAIALSVLSLSIMLTLPAAVLCAHSPRPSMCYWYNPATGEVSEVFPDQAAAEAAPGP